MKEEALKEKNIYTTSDLSLAATLRLYFSLLGIDMNNPSQAKFIFEQSKELEKVKRAYWEDELEVNAKSLLYSLRTLKSQLHDKK